MIAPVALRPGGKIGICAPSGPVDASRLTAAVASLQHAGFEVECAPSCFGRSGYLSAPDQERARELEQLFARDDVDAVICARGGVGASRLLEILNTTLIAKRPKPFLGFSDNTALQWLLSGRHELISFSGPMAVDWSGLVSEHTLHRAIDMLTGHAPADLLSEFSCDSLRALRGNGTLSGRLMPGNLTMITTLLGTPYLPNLNGALLVIEDVNEPPYRIDRMLFHLRNAGILNRIGGLLCGDLCSGKDDSDHDSVRQAVLDATRGTMYPIVMGIPYGHGSERVTFPVGAAVEMNLNSMTMALRDAVTTVAVS